MKKGVHQLADAFLKIAKASFRTPKSFCFVDFGEISFCEFT
jgi:hypothetical protein